MKLTEMLISAILKKGVLFEGQNIDLTTTLPGDEKVKVYIKAERITITMIKDEE